MQCLTTLKVMQSQEGLPANATPQKWTSNNALAAILDSLAAILRISNADEYSRELLPEVSGCCKKLLNIAHPDVKVGFSRQRCRNSGQVVPKK